MRPDRSGYGARTVTAALLAATMLAGTVLAQEPGIVVVSPRPELKWLHFHEIDVALELEWRRDVDEVDRAVGGEVRDVQDRFREVLELGTRGFAGHPNLLQLDLSGRFRLTQRLLDLDSTGTNETVDEFLLEYDFSGLFLAEQKFPVLVYSRRNQSDIDRVFGGSLEQTWTQTGAQLTVRDDRFPTNIQVYTRELEQNDSSLNQDFILDQNSLEADGRVELGASQSLWWDFTYDDVDQSGDLRATQSFERIEGNLTHTLDFGDTDQHQLRSVLRLFDLSGDIDHEQFLFTERLRLRPNDDLLTWFDYRFEDLQRSSVKVRSHRGSG
ncbi:MAG: hypothetical protein ACYTBR_13825, partial [Planctomycetota bacterium]